MQTIHAYFDESGSHKGSPVLCVAGYAFEKRNAKRLSSEWTSILRHFELPYFHMVECAHGNGVFAKLTKRARIQVATEMIRTIKKRASFGFAISVDPEAFSEVMPTWGPAKSAYAFCARCAIDEMGRWFFKTRFRGKSNYFFESGHESRSEADRVISNVLTNPLQKSQRIHYGYNVHAFVLKADAPPIQAADMLAWHWATHVKRLHAQKPPRKDFASLVELTTVGSHFDRNKLLEYVELLKEFGLDKDHQSDSLMQTVRRVQRIRQRVLPALLRPY